MLVTRIIGACPKCKRPDTYGNVMVGGNTLTRGCGYCTFTEQLYLPALHKKVLYLDQFFFSHAFRASQPEFVEAIEHIIHLAHDQLLVSPYSSIHETETFQWRHIKRDALWKFIKQTSRGYKFEPTYDIRREQICEAFSLYKNQLPPRISLNRSDALADNVDEWDNYFWVDLEHEPENVEKVRELKEKGTSDLIALFPQWRESKNTFDEHRVYELRVAGRSYVDMYVSMLARIASGDYMATIDSPIDTMIVETMVRELDPEISLRDQMRLIQSFFLSEHFAAVPYEDISTRITTMLREQVKNGSFPNPEKARSQLSGFFHDMQFIATYAPYCDAMFVDSAMHNLVAKEQVGIEAKYGTKIFSKNNWEEFLLYLNKIEQYKDQDHENALKLVYPA